MKKQPELKEGVVRQSKEIPGGEFGIWVGARVKSKAKKNLYIQETL